MVKKGDSRDKMMTRLKIKSNNINSQDFKGKQRGNIVDNETTVKDKKVNKVLTLTLTSYK